MTSDIDTQRGPGLLPARRPCRPQPVAQARSHGAGPASARTTVVDFPRLSTSVEATATRGWSLVRVVGEIDLGTVVAFTHALTAVDTPDRRGVVVDFGDVAFCSVGGLRALADAAARARARGVSFVLVGASATTARALRTGWPDADLHR